MTGEEIKAIDASARRAPKRHLVLGWPIQMGRNSNARKRHGFVI
jgi:hypothetical protein